MKVNAQTASVNFHNIHRTIRLRINPLISGLLWAAYLVCLLSGVQSPYPATAVVTVSANTLTTDPTYMCTGWSWIGPQVSFTSFAGFNKVQICTGFDTAATNIKIFTNDMTLKGQFSTGKNLTDTAVLKDSLRLVAGGYEYASTDKFSFTLTVSGDVLAQSSFNSVLASPNAMGRKIGRASCRERVLMPV